MSRTHLPSKRRCGRRKNTKAKWWSSLRARRGQCRYYARRWRKARTARAIAAAIQDEKFDLIFTRFQSDDCGYAQTGVILAEILGLPHATIIMQIEKRIDKNDGGIRVKRELEAGFFQFVDMPLPAVLTIQSGINKLRYATLIGIKQAKMKPMRKVTMAEVQSAVGGNLQKIEKLHVPQKSKNTEFLEGPPAEVAKKLVEKMKNELRVI